MKRKAPAKRRTTRPKPKRPATRRTTPPAVDELIAKQRAISDPRKYEREFREADAERLGVLLARLGINNQTAGNLRWILGELRDDPPETLASIAAGMAMRAGGALKLGTALADALPPEFFQTWQPRGPWTEALILEAIRKLAASGKPVPESHDGFIYCKAIGVTSQAGLPVLVDALRYLPPARARAILEAASSHSPIGALCAVHAITAPDLVARLLELIANNPLEVSSPRDQKLAKKGLQLLPAHHDADLQTLALQVSEPRLRATIDGALAARKRGRTSTLGAAPTRSSW